MIENTGPRIDPKQAVDLSKVGREADERRLQELEQAEREAEEKTRRWFKAMKSAFKGTGFTHAQRVRNLQLAAQRAEREGD
jgi:hypothetical protein